MKLHRAKVKSFEDIPWSFKCCDPQIKELERNAGEEMVIDLETIGQRLRKCVFCETPLPLKTAVVVGGPHSGVLVHIDGVDIDEAPYVS